MYICICKNCLLCLFVSTCLYLSVFTCLYLSVFLSLCCCVDGEGRSRSRTMANDTSSSSADPSAVAMTGKIGRYKSEDSTVSEHQKHRSVVLEHLLHTTHIHGDGENRYIAALSENMSRVVYMTLGGKLSL
jgi:hypothetical protein